MFLGKNYKKLNMKKLVLLFSMFLSISLFAQKADLIIFSEDGEKFKVYLNGMLQNQDFETNVKIQGLTQEFYSSRIVFEDNKNPEIKKNLAVKGGLEVTYRIKRIKSGALDVRYFTEAPMGTEVSSPNVEVITYSESPSTETTDYGDDETVVTQTTTYQTTSPTRTTEKVNMNVNMPGVNLNVNLPTVDMTINESSTTTVTTTTSSTGGARNNTTRNTNTTAASPTIVGGCGSSMTAAQFNTAKSSISSKPFEENKLQIAKQIISKNCMNTNQIKEVLGAFSFEESKLDFAKYAYKYCTNQNEYYVINDAFSFSDSIDQLDQFINSQQ